MYYTTITTVAAATAAASVAVYQHFNIFLNRIEYFIANISVVKTWR